MEDIPEHLRFAFYCAREDLEDLVWGFDFERQAGMHTSTETDPSHKLRVINGLLEHESQNLDPHSINRFREMKTIFENRLIPLYEQGKDRTIQIWQRAPIKEKSRLEALSNKEIREMARNLAPNDLKPSELSWFMEGFCYQWGQEWFQYVVWRAAKDIEEEEEKREC